MLQVNVYATHLFFEASIAEKLDPLNDHIATAIAMSLDKYMVKPDSVPIQWLQILYGRNPDDLGIEIMLADEYVLTEEERLAMVKAVSHKAKELSPIKGIVIGVRLIIANQIYLPARN